MPMEPPWVGQGKARLLYVLDVTNQFFRVKFGKFGTVRNTEANAS